MNTHKDFRIRLLPNKVKLLGYSLLIISIIVIILGKKIGYNSLATVGKYLFYSALTLLAFSRDKIEDELTISLRINAYSLAFAFGAVSVVINPLLNHVLGFNLSLTAEELILRMLFMYFAYYYIIKKTR